VSCDGILRSQRWSGDYASDSSAATCLEPGGVVGVTTPIEEHTHVHVALAVRATLSDAAEHIRRDNAGNRHAVQDAPKAGTRIGFG
jgi:hypothetical protein